LEAEGGIRRTLRRRTVRRTLEAEAGKGFEWDRKEKAYTERRGMAMEVYSDRVELTVSGKRMWKAAFEESDQVLPRSAPGIVDRVEILGGNNKYEVGSIRTIHFTRGLSVCRSLSSSSSSVLPSLTKLDLDEKKPKLT
jgi:hypothetical protein